MEKYKVAVLGFPIDSTEKIIHCLQMFWWNINESLKLLSEEVEVVPLPDMGFIDGAHRFIESSIEHIPMVDYLIVGAIDFFYTEKTIQLLKTKCKKIFSFLEIGEPVDFSFIFTNKYYRQKEEKCKILPAPYGNFYINTPKDKNTVLLDHSAWFNNATLTKEDFLKLEMTDQIFSWMEDLKDEYKIYSLTYRGSQGEAALKIMPSYITPIEAQGMKGYLEATNKMETFITTHAGSYNLSVIDMLVRGIRVITKEEFIPKYNIDLFNIPLFKDKESLLKEIRKPVETEYWNNQIKKCTSIEKTAQEFLNKFREG